MEVALESLKNTADSSKVEPALKLLKTYFDNISKDPQNPKYRKIRIGNPKFNATIWEIEEARTFLLLVGFEQNGDFLILPDHIGIDTAKLLIKSCLGSSQTTTSQQHIPPTSNNEKTQSSTLKLAPAKGGSYFDEEIKANLTLLSYMVEMGFDKSSSEQALIATKNAGVQPAMDWLATNYHLLQQNKSIANTVNSNDSTMPSTSTGLDVTADARPAPVSRYQKTADERHKFQEKLRLEAIETARAERIAKQQHKEFLLKEMQSEKEEKKEMNEMSKKLKTLAQTSEGLCSTETMSVDREQSENDVDPKPQDQKTELKIRLPDGMVTDLTLPNGSLIKQLYRHIARLKEMDENEFTIMTMYPQTELTDMTMTLMTAGLNPRATLVVQRKDQLGMVTEGHGKVCTVKTITSLDEWQALITNNNHKLVVVEFIASWCANCRSVEDRFETLNGQYGIGQAVIFARVDVDQLKVLKYQMHISTLPTFKLYWNENEIITVEGTNMEELEEQIKTNQHGPDETQLTDQDPR